MLGHCSSNGKRGSTSGWLFSSLLAAVPAAVVGLFACAEELQETEPPISIPGAADAATSRSYWQGQIEKGFQCTDGFAAREHPHVVENDTFHGDGRFEFCPSATDLSLQNMAALAFLAADEYGHFGYVAPVLDELGFDQSEIGGASWWTNCADSMYYLRCAESLEQLDADPSNWPEEMRCARLFAHERWPEVTDLRSEGWGQSFSVAAEFEHWLVSTNHPEWGIQFISGSRYVLGHTVYDQGTTQLLWAEHDSLPLVIIAFRGTKPDTSDHAWYDVEALWQQIQDILVDLNATPVEFSLPNDDDEWEPISETWRATAESLDCGDDCGVLVDVHEGFFTAFQSIYTSRLEHLLLALADRPQQPAIWITGHSLGGALATLTTAAILWRKESDQRFDHLDVRGLVTFGSPRVGDENFELLFDMLTEANDVSVARVVHQNDIVPRVPLEWQGFDHAGQMVYIGGMDDKNCLDQVGAVPCLLYRDEDLEWWDGWLAAGSVDDHATSSYYNVLLHHLESNAFQDLTTCR